MPRLSLRVNHLLESLRLLVNPQWQLLEQRGHWQSALVKKWEHILHLPAIPDRKNLLLKTTGIVQPITKLRFSYLLLINAQKKVEGQPHRLKSRRYCNATFKLIFFVLKKLRKSNYIADNNWLLTIKTGWPVCCDKARGRWNDLLWRILHRFIWATGQNAPFHFRYLPIPGRAVRRYNRKRYLGWHDGRAGK